MAESEESSKEGLARKAGPSGVRIRLCGNRMTERQATLTHGQRPSFRLPPNQATLQDPLGLLGSLAIVRCSQKLGFA